MPEHQARETAAWNTGHVPRHYADEQSPRRPQPRPRTALLGVDTCDRLFARLSETERRVEALARRVNGDLHPLVLSAYGPPPV